MVGIAAVRVERAARHVGNVLSQCLRHERFGIHAFRKRYPREETALRVCKGEAGREILFHAVVHQCTAFAVDVTEFGNMFVDIEHIEEERNLALRKGRDLQVRRLFVLDGLVDNSRIGDHPGHAQTGHHDFREGAEEDDLAFLVQGFEGRQLFDVVAEFAVRVVFDDGEIVFFEDFHESFAPFEGPGDARRVLEFRDDISQFDLITVFLTDLFEFFRDDALFVRRHFHELRAAELKGVDGAEVGRAFDEDDVAGIDEEIRQVRKALLGTGGDEDFVFRAVDEEGFLHAFTDVLAQGQIAFGRTVLDGGAPFLIDDGIRRLPQFFHREEFRCRQAAGEGNNFGLRRQFQEFTDLRGFQIHSYVRKLHINHSFKLYESRVYLCIHSIIKITFMQLNVCVIIMLHFVQAYKSNVNNEND